MKALKKEFFLAFSHQLFSHLNPDEQLTINLSAEDTLFARFSKSRIRQVTEVEQAYAGLDFIKGKKALNLNLRYTGDISEDLPIFLQELNRAREFLAILPEDPYLVRPNNLGNSHHESTYHELSSEQMISLIATAAAPVDMAGILMSGDIVSASINSEGQEHWFKTQSFAFDYSLYNSKQKAVKAVYAGNQFNPLELKKNIDEATSKLQLMSQNILKVPKGKYRTYLAPSAVQSLLETLSWMGVSMSSHKRGKGPLKQLWKNEKKLSPLFTLAENFELNFCPRFNSQGEVAPMTIPLITKGEFQNFLISTRTANEYNLSSNFASEWEQLRSATIAPGTVAEKDIIKTIDTGLYISDLHYLNWSDIESARITGMTRYAAFWVEKGELVSPIEDLRFDESYYHIFGDGLLGLTSEESIIPSTGTYFQRDLGAMKVPGIFVDQFNFTL